MIKVLSEFTELWLHTRRWFYVSCVLLILGAYLVSKFFCLSKGDAAAWVQAIGSIGAIIGAAWIADWQHRQEKKDQKTQAIQNRLDFILSVAAIVDHANNQITEASSIFGSDGDTYPEKSVTQIKRKLTIAAAAIDQIPLIKIQDYKLTSDLIDLRRAVGDLHPLLSEYVDISNEDVDLMTVNNDLHRLASIAASATNAVWATKVQLIRNLEPDEPNESH